MIHWTKVVLPMCLVFYGTAMVLTGGWWAVTGVISGVGGLVLLVANIGAHRHWHWTEKLGVRE